VIADHKLAPHSTVCIFLGYSSQHKGYHCLDLSSNKIIISRHVTFHETSFPFSEVSSPPSSDFDFLSEFDIAPVIPIGCPCVSGSQVARTAVAPAAPNCPAAPADILSQAVASGALGAQLPATVRGTPSPAAGASGTPGGHLPAASLRAYQNGYGYGLV
jgi:hypothetical protein